MRQGHTAVETSSPIFLERPVGPFLYHFDAGEPAVGGERAARIDHSHIEIEQRRHRRQRDCAMCTAPTMMSPAVAHRH